MKRSFILITGLVLLIFLYSCSKNYLDDFYGNYTFEKVIYLAPLSSCRPDYINKTAAGTKYTIKEDLFKIELKNHTVEIKSPNYMKEDVKKDDSPFSVDIHAMLGDDVKYQYDIYTKDGKSIWRLYVSPDNLWVSSYTDNTADGSEIIFDIYKLSK